MYAARATEDLFRLSLRPKPRSLLLKENSLFFQQSRLLLRE
jgi:hypothetical protein